MSDEREFAVGGCACGAVRFRLTATPLIVHCCHCRWCQRETGSAFVLNAIIEADHVEVVRGAPALVAAPSESGKGQIFARCPVCQIALWSNYAGAGDKLHFVRVGTLDNPDLAPPDIHIFTESKQPWVELSLDIPAVAQYYSRKDYWPEESIARAKLATGG